MRRPLLCIILVAIALSGCKLGELTPEQIGQIAGSVQTIGQAARPMSDSEEYYVGRAVAARLLATYPLYRNKRQTDYINLVGQTLALHSDVPTTYGGYHFALLDSSEINAFACPGGTILITRGMLATLKNEDELAAVLAHEIGHVIHRDGIAAIRSARWSEVLTLIGGQAAQEFGSKEAARLASLFEGSIDDVVKTLVVNGYGRDQELAADRSALFILGAAGYDPQGLLGYLQRLEQAGQSSSGGILSTHPGVDQRVQAVRSGMPLSGPPSTVAQRSRRFAETLR